MESVPTLKSIKCGAAMQLKNQRKQHSNGLHLLRSNLFTNISKSIMKISMKSTAIFLFLIWKTRNRTHWKTNSFAKRNKRSIKTLAISCSKWRKKRTKAKLKSTMYVPCRDGEWNQFPPLKLVKSGAAMQLKKNQQKQQC